MAKRMFSVTAHWDEEAKVFYSDSDIIGLHIEAPTVDEFESVMMDVAPGLVMANHVSKAELATNCCDLSLADNSYVSNTNVCS